MEEILKAAGGDVLDICKMLTLTDAPKFEPFVDADGKPVRRTIQFVLELKHPATDATLDK